ncbi:MocR-like transcription factor YczR [Streptomonospora nanhaiensis]|uniref:DNA-binding transcriptional MocR family regulator n=1 Tax=Streptomonospora nanhaiensis TaxID=1323731 RepID=A0A853BGN6_9ACTN|nr:PLP-dependent aminotransferase family protein [Streptomonospora nanhaiensis]NYI94638.1 DNA-binding transcriptional MocR family regulator [Streptomonospora nanhaiensis]
MVGERRINGHLLARLIGAAARERPYYLGVARAISGLVLDGRVPTYTRLPAERDLAAALGVSRNTVTAAYAWLRENGYLDSRQGAGSWTVLPDSGPGGGQLLPHTEHVDLGIAAPAAIDGLQQAARLAVDQLAAHVGGIGYNPRGLPELRHAIARRYVERGLPTAPEQICVTNGAQHAVALLLGLLADPGDTLLAESPSYPHALDAARRHGLQVRAAGVTPSGWDMDHVLDAFRRFRPRLAYLIPDFQNPTGALMDDEERAAVVAEARRADAALIVDESVAELAIDSGDQPAPTAAHDTDGRVYTVGSVAKTFWGGLRIGWVRTTPPMVERLAAARQRVDLSSSLMDQLTVTHLFADMLRVRAERSRQLARNRDALVAVLRERIPEWRCSRPSGGLVLWAGLPRPAATALREAGARHGVHLAPGPLFGADGTLEHYVRLSYTLPPEVLADGVERLARAWAETAARPGAPRHDLYV